MANVKKTKAAIIDGVLVPPTENTVLKALVKLGRPATVPELDKSMNGEISDAALYKLLGRLVELRGLVTREESWIEVHGTKLRRILWRPDQLARNSSWEISHDPTSSQTSKQVEGATAG